MIALHRLVQLLLIGGIVGPVQFTLVYLLEGATRPGYNAVQDAVSLLGLTDAGWVDALSVVVNGLLLMGFGLAVLHAFRSKGWRWGPLLLMLAGFGITVAGVFPTDPSQGYPPGTPTGPAVVTTLHGNIHALVGAPATFGGLTASCVVFAWSYRHDPEWSAWSPYALVTAVAIVASFIGFVVSAFLWGPAGLFERIAFTAAFLWIVALAIRLLRTPQRVRPDPDQWRPVSAQPPIPSAPTAATAPSERRDWHLIDRIRDARRRYRRGLLYPAAMLTLGAAAIHFSVAPDHLEEFPAFGILFLVVGVVQLALAVLIVVLPGRQVFATGMAVAAACLLVWGVSRTVGLPVGPHPGQPEALGLADALTSAFEALSLLLFLLLLRSSPPRSMRRWWLAGTMPIGLLLTIATVIGVVAGINPLPYAVNMGSAAPGSTNVTMADLNEPPGRQPEKDFTLTAEVAHIQLLGGQVAWTYNGTVPGPELRVMQGDRLRVTLINHLPASTSIHWHGLRLPNADDGVAGITQDAVPPGGQYTYEFVVKDPGTYWYHSHQDTENQVPLGLYGALVVEPAQGPAYDRDYTVMLGDANRTRPVQLDARPGELVRLRVISAFQEDMNGTPELLTLMGAPYRVIALDGHDLNGPTEMGVELLPIGTGQRYDLAYRMPASGQVRLFDMRPQTGSAQPARDWASLGEGSMRQLNLSMPVFDRSKPLGYVSSSLTTFDPTTYGIAAPDPVASRGTYDASSELVITNQPGLRYGSHLDRIPLKLIHMFNGKSFPDTMPIVVREGQYVRLRLVNKTDEYHPIHLHGHVYSVISRNGKPLTGSPVHLDSILVGPRETWEGAFLADNPGLWMLHCHVLIHAAFGLSTMVSYVGIATPYVIGSKSGNFPE